MIDLGSLNGSDSSQAADINNAGQVVGSFFTTDGFNHAFLWEAVNGMTDLGTPAGFTNGSATGINETGQVTGWAYDSLSPRYTTFLWDAPNGMAALGTSPGYTDSDGTAINNAGQVAGNQWYTSQSTHAFRWTPDSPNGLTGDFTDLGLLYFGIESS